MFRFLVIVSTCSVENIAARSPTTPVMSLWSRTTVRLFCVDRDRGRIDLLAAAYTSLAFYRCSRVNILFSDAASGLNIDNITGVVFVRYIVKWDSIVRWFRLARTCRPKIPIQCFRHGLPDWTGAIQRKKKDFCTIFLGYFFYSVFYIIELHQRAIIILRTNKWIRGCRWTWRRQTCCPGTTSEDPSGERKRFVTHHKNKKKVEGFSFSGEGGGRKYWNEPIFLTRGGQPGNSNDFARYFFLIFLRLVYRFMYSLPERWHERRSVVWYIYSARFAVYDFFRSKSLFPATAIFTIPCYIINITRNSRRCPLSYARKHQQQRRSFSDRRDGFIPFSNVFMRPAFNSRKTRGWNDRGWFAFPRVVESPAPLRRTAPQSWTYRRTSVVYDKTVVHTHTPIDIVVQTGDNFFNAVFLFRTVCKVHTYIRKFSDLFQ